MELLGLLFVVMTLAYETRGVRHVVYWDSEQIPKLANGGLEITLEVDDYMDVLCPFPVNYGEFYYPKRGAALLQLFNVTRQEYFECDTGHGIRLQSCDNPTIEKKLTTKFQERSPYPFGFTFRAGATYYYLSKPLNDASKGCTQDAMRMMVHVRTKGSVFERSDRERTRTYHLMHDEDKAEKRVTINDRPENPKRPHRHHHHEKAATTAAPTKRPKVVIQYEKPRRTASRARPEKVTSTNPENAAVSSQRPAITTLICSTALALFLTCFRSRE